MTDTLDRLSEIVGRMTAAPWTYSCCYGVATIEHGKDREAIAHAVDYLTPNNADGIVDLRNCAAELIALAKAAQDFIVNQRTGFTKWDNNIDHALCALEAKLATIGVSRSGSALDSKSSSEGSIPSTPAGCPSCAAKTPEECGCTQEERAKAYREKKCPP